MATKVKESIIARYEICNHGDQMLEQAIQRLAYAMDKRSINTNNLQKDAGLSNGTIYRFFNADKEGNMQRNTSTSVMMRVCMALNVSADWLLFGDGQFRPLSCGEPYLRPEPYDPATDELSHTTRQPDALSVTSDGVRVPDRSITPDVVNAVWSGVRPNAYHAASVTPELIAQAMQTYDSPLALDEIVLKGANNDVLLSIIRMLQSQITELNQLHTRDMAVLSEAQLKNSTLQSVNATLRATIAQLSDSLSVPVPKAGDILSPSSEKVMDQSAPGSSVADDSTLPGSRS